MGIADVWRLHSCSLGTKGSAEVEHATPFDRMEAIERTRSEQTASERRRRGARGPGAAGGVRYGPDVGQLQRVRLKNGAARVARCANACSKQLTVEPFHSETHFIDLSVSALSYFSPSKEASFFFLNRRMFV